MSLTSDCAAWIAMRSGGWGGTRSVVTHIHMRESWDMKSSQLVPLSDWVASDPDEDLVETEFCVGATGGVELWLAELDSKTFLL